MKQSDLASKLARQQKISRAQAADRVDRAVHKILRRLREGKATTLPGLGTLRPGKTTRFQSDPAAKEPPKRSKKG